MKLISSHFYQEEIKKDPLLVTPIGICLNFYDQKNHFIMVQFNEERIKLYNNAHLTLVDAAMQAKFPNADLFPKRGKELNFTVNGVSRMQRGALGEAAVITINDHSASLNSPIQANDKITIVPSTTGEAAKLSMEELPEYKGVIHVQVNGKHSECPKYMQVNGELVSNFYEIKEGDEIVNLDYYTLKQVLDFLDIIPEYGMEFFVNNKLCGLEEKVYDNFSVDWKKGSEETNVLHYEKMVETEEIIKEEKTENVAPVPDSIFASRQMINPIEKQELEEKKRLEEEKEKESQENQVIKVMFNGSPATLTGKKSYVFVDVFDAVNFELKNIPGKKIVTMLNGQNAVYMNPLYNGDVIDVFWEDL